MTISFVASMSGLFKFYFLLSFVDVIISDMECRSDIITLKGED